TAFSILIALIIGVLTATIVACYFDLKSRQVGLNKLPEAAEWVYTRKKRLPLRTPKGPSVRFARTPSTRNQGEKHKRMIEAVYIASGRAVPAQFVSAPWPTATLRPANPP
ncbi:hypothetical protein PENTCL1PPCAC_29462, partial [Pristionchus entomophagus]